MNDRRNPSGESLRHDLCVAASRRAVRTDGNAQEVVSTNSGGSSHGMAASINRTLYPDGDRVRVQSLLLPSANLSRALAASPHFHIAQTRAEVIRESIVGPFCDSKGRDVHNQWRDAVMHHVMRSYGHAVSYPLVNQFVEAVTGWVVHCYLESDYDPSNPDDSNVRYARLFSNSEAWLTLIGTHDHGTDNSDSLRTIMVAELTPIITHFCGTFAKLNHMFRLVTRVGPIPYESVLSHDRDAMTSERPLKRADYPPSSKPMSRQSGEAQVSRANEVRRPAPSSATVGGKATKSNPVPSITKPKAPGSLRASVASLSKPKVVNSAKVPAVAVSSRGTSVAGAAASSGVSNRVSIPLESSDDDEPVYRRPAGNLQKSPVSTMLCVCGTTFITSGEANSSGSKGSSRARPGTRPGGVASSSKDVPPARNSVPLGATSTAGPTCTYLYPCKHTNTLTSLLQDL